MIVIAQIAINVFRPALLEKRLVYYYQPFPFFPFFPICKSTMPAVESTQYWTVRLTTDDPISIGVAQFPDSLHGIYVEETATRRHFHIALTFAKKVTNKQLTAMLDKAYPSLRGNACRQKKQWRTGHDLTEDEFIQYMFKSGQPVQWGNRDDWPGDDYFVSQCLKKQQALMIGKKKRQSGLPTVITDVLQRVKDRRSTLLGFPSSLMSDVIDEYFAYHDENKLRLKGTYMMKTDIENIMFHSGNQFYRREWKCAIMRQISQNLEQKYS